MILFQRIANENHSTNIDEAKRAKEHHFTVLFSATSEISAGDLKKQVQRIRGVSASSVEVHTEHHEDDWD